MWLYRVQTPHFAHAIKENMTIIVNDVTESVRLKVSISASLSHIDYDFTVYNLMGSIM